jgi:hypothetical protein
MSDKERDFNEFKEHVYDTFGLEQKKKDDDFNATVTAGGRTVEFKTCLLSGMANDGEDTPMAMFVGRFDLHEFGIILMSQLRAVYKILQREFEMDNPEAEDFVVFCLANAIKIEEEAKRRVARGEAEYGESVLKMTKDNS